MSVPSVANQTGHCSVESHWSTSEMQKILFAAIVVGLLALALGHDNPHEVPKPQPHPPKTSGGGGGGGGGVVGGSVTGTCPKPTPENVRCMQQWACQQIIRLDLRCLLNLNGNNLLGNLLGGGGAAGGGTGGTAGTGGSGGGLLGGLLGR